jgi:hypothetical protein
VNGWTALLESYEKYNVDAGSVQIKVWTALLESSDQRNVGTRVSK